MTDNVARVYSTEVAIKHIESIAGKEKARIVNKAGSCFAGTTSGTISGSVSIKSIFKK